MKRVPIKWAEAIADRTAADAVVVLSFKADGAYCATSYGATKAKCAVAGRWIDDLCDRLSSGALPPPRLK